MAADRSRRPRARVLALGLMLGLGLGLGAALCQANPTPEEPRKMIDQQPTSATLDARQQAIVPVAAFAAAGDMARLNGALEQGLGAGLTVNELKEVLVQLYAYVGFPRSLNALGELMKVVEARRARGIHDPQGPAPQRPVPTGEALLAAGTANQTRLSGAPVRGALFEFAPAADTFLKTHLFGDIFERDNLDWRSRELATVSMLAMLAGAESQLQSHLRISMNVGITKGQLTQLGQVLEQGGAPDAGTRVRAALAQVGAAAK